MFKQLNLTELPVARQSGPKGGTSRIRFIMLEAEIPEGDLDQVTAAIQNALKPTTTIIQQRLPSRIANSPNEAQILDVEPDGEFVEQEEEAQSVSPEQRSVREQRPRKPTAMKVLDLDLTSDVSFEHFVSNHMPKSDAERNLVVLAWFKEHRHEEAVTANHVYTCYRAIKWPSGIDDFSATLRSLKKQQLVSSPSRGQYSINHLGIARVEKLGPAS